MSPSTNSHETMMADKYKRLDTLSTMLNLKFVNLGHYICASYHSEIQRTSKDISDLSKEIDTLQTEIINLERDAMEDR